MPSTAVDPGATDSRWAQAYSELSRGLAEAAALCETEPRRGVRRAAEVFASAGELTASLEEDRLRFLELVAGLFLEDRTPLEMKAHLLELSKRLARAARELRRIARELRVARETEDRA